MSREDSPQTFSLSSSPNHFREEPQPLSPARRKVSFKTPSGVPVQKKPISESPSDTKRVARESNQTPSPVPHHRPIDHLSGHEFLVNPSPKPKKKSRPKHFYESPRVHIRTVFMKVGEVDTVKEKFDADIFMQARWREPALDSQHPMKAEVNWAEIWNPGVVIQNLLDSRYDKTWHEMEVTSIGEAFVIERRRVKGTFAENMELQNFPFDTQHLSLVLTAEELDVELVEDSREPSLVHHLSFVDEQEWEIRDLVECVATTGTAGDMGRLPPTGTVLVVRIHARRRGGFFFWNIVVITCLICSLILCTFSVSRNHPTNRLQLSFTVVLTVVAFKFVTNHHIPKISYLTILDKYILSALTLVHLVSVWHASICLAPNNSLTDALDLAAFITCAVAFIVMQLAFAIHVKRSVRMEQAILLQLEKHYQEKVNRLMGAGYTDRVNEERKRKKFQRRFLPDVSVGTI